MIGSKLSDAQQPVERVPDTVAEVVGDAHALVDTLADSLPEVEAETLGDTLSDAQALVDRLADP